MKRAKFVIVILAILIGLLGTWLSVAGTVETSREIQEGIAGKIIRFHVLANSDSEADQALKLKVRDGVIRYLEDSVDKAQSVEDARGMILEQLDVVAARAEEVIAENGYAYPVEAGLRKLYFPVKSYGDVTLPEGIYEALQVRIGEAAGHNWWCVIYPGLCFVEDSYEVVADEKLGELEDLLTREEFEAVMKDKKFKIGWKWF